MEKQRLILLVAVVCIFTFSCNTGTNSDAESRVFHDTWYSEWNEDNGEMILIRGSAIDSTNLNPHDLVDALNSSKKVQLKFLQTKADTIFVQVINDEVLTEQMGTYGADEYLGVATLTLLELKNINKVCYSFDYGSHASPGTYTRKDFECYIKK